MQELNRPIDAHLQQLLARNRLADLDKDAATQPRPRLAGPRIESAFDRNGKHRCLAAFDEQPHTSLEGPHGSVFAASALGKERGDTSVLQLVEGRSHRGRIGGATLKEDHLDANTQDPRDRPRGIGLEAAAGHRARGPVHYRNAQHHRIKMGLVVGDHDGRAGARDVLAASNSKPPQQPEHESDGPRNEGEPKQQSPG